ncbi:MAG: hypothetical protein EBY28_21560 [Betaproteobacteria bacterium]|nr:hypothetical protein [Betaproteobacteria bacterium]
MADARRGFDVNAGLVPRWFGPRARRVQPLGLAPFSDPSMRPAKSLKDWPASLPDPQAGSTAALLRQAVATAASTVCLPMAGIAMDSLVARVTAFSARTDIGLKTI